MRSAPRLRGRGETLTAAGCWRVGQVPRLIRVLLSPDGVRFQNPSAGVQVVPPTPEDEHGLRDLDSLDMDEEQEVAQEVSIPLGGRPARSVRVQLFFAATWILLSEVTFDSGEWRPDPEDSGSKTGRKFLFFRCR